MQTISVWKVTRINGEVIEFEAQTEREVRLLARESFPNDGSFEVVLVSTRCERCRTTVPASTRCEACRARREARKRFYIVSASFLLAKGWTKPVEVRVKAFSVVGATAQGVREAKRTVVKRGARIAQVKAEVLNVGRQART